MEAVKGGQMRYLLPDPAYNQVSDAESSNSSSNAAPELGSFYNDSLTSATNLNLSLILNLKLNQTATTSPPPSYYDYVYEYDDYDYEETTPTITTMAGTSPPVPDHEAGPRIGEVMGPYYLVKMAADKEQLGMLWNSLKDMYTNQFTRPWAQAQPPTATEVETPTSSRVIEKMLI